MVNSDGSFIFDARQTFESVPAGQTVFYELYYLAPMGSTRKQVELYSCARSEQRAYSYG